MNVLIADDEPMTRSLLRRVLTRECGCTVIEAADGLAALSSCGTTPPDLILTDLRMPVMDGIALIEALRQVPALAAIPVVMMTAARDQGPVHRAIELGVTDYLLKPLQADRVADRLRSVVERVRASDASAVEDRTPLLVADGKADFRQLVAAALGPLRVVHQAQSGVAALQRAVETRPGVILVGGDLGLLGPDLLMRKLRAAGELAGTRIVAVVERGSEAVIPEPADAVLIRTSSADVLRAQLSKITGRGAAAGAIAADAALRSQLAAVAEQELRALLQLDMQHTSEIQPRPVPRMIVASKGIALPDRAASILTLRTDLPSAAKIAAGMPRDGATPVPDEDAALVAVAHVLDAVAGRLAHSDAAGGDTATRPAPSCQLMGAGDLSAGAEGRVQVTVYTADGVAQLVLQLTAAGAAAGPLPAEAKAAPVAAS
jgi:CheY-like chemotaxis protein